MIRHMIAVPSLYTFFSGGKRGLLRSLIIYSCFCRSRMVVHTLSVMSPRSRWG